MYICVYIYIYIYIKNRLAGCWKADYGCCVRFDRFVFYRFVVVFCCFVVLTF